MKEFDLIIKNGTVVTSTESFLCDPTFSYRILKNQKFIFVPMPDDLTFLIAKTWCH